MVFSLVTWQPGAPRSLRHTASSEKHSPTILFDIAEDTEDLKTFRADVHKFFKGINHSTEKEWQAAVLEVRAGKITAEAICEGLKTKPADSRLSVMVKLLKVFKTKDNILEPQMAMAA